MEGRMAALGMDNMSLCLRVAAVVAPIAIYFLILGLLNSRRHPQLLSSRQDLTLLVAALSPLLALPAVTYFQNVWFALAVIAGGGLAVVALLTPSGSSWVIYNVSPQHGRSMIEALLRELDQPFVSQFNGLKLADSDGFIQFSDFALLRNMTFRLHGTAQRLEQPLIDHLRARLRRHVVEPSHMAVGLLLVATAMLVVPLSLVAQRAPELVRLIGDLVR